ncbi:hypothetical protein [Mycoplasma procyoni]|uniref:hypothetical protein n=1 Tax=Mycoplasma procyoni TaxID=568784 RepID=UPI00197B5E5A|nr:hypothetical protein [Mycoplasma procyoni]MBN3534712.1 hypothetical protein [Mycoplasma procyoni]
MDKKQVRKHEFLDFVVYKIFSSEYNENFVLEGSEGIFIKSLNRRLIYYKLPKDLDLNIISLKGTAEKIEKTLKGIFQEEKDIEIKLDQKLYEERERIRFKIKQINNEGDSVSNLGVDVVLENQNFTIEWEEFNFNEHKINIQTYNIEKYIANKIISLRKVHNKNRNYLSGKIDLNKFISKNEFQNITEICWLFNNYSSELKEILRNLKLMYDPKIFNVSLLEYIEYLAKYFRNSITNDDIIAFIHYKKWSLEYFDFMAYLRSNFDNLVRLLKREVNDENRTDNL